MILLIDNYDSFSYNLYQLIGSINPDIKVVRNDQMTIDEIRALKPEHRDYPIYGVQFHPESILTPDGHEILKNFCDGGLKK